MAMAAGHWPLAKASGLILFLMPDAGIFNL
jgi:hypothetical protein